MTTKPIAVIILNWNGAKILDRYLPSAIELTNRVLADIIIADNGSTDDSVEIIQQRYASEVTLLTLDKNYGFAEGYNRAIKAVSHPYVLLLNSDVRVTKGWIEPLYDFMENHPQTVAVQPRLRSDREPSKLEYAGAMGGYMDYLGYPFCRGRIFDTIEKDQGQYPEEPTPVFWTSGAAMLVRRDAYERIGGLEGSFFAHQEEIDLCWRWQSTGYDLYVIPESTVYHYGGATLSTENPRKTFLNFRNNLRMLFRNLPTSRLLPIFWLRLWLDMIAAITFLLQGKRHDALAVIRAWGAFIKTGEIRTKGDRKRSYRRLYQHTLLWRYHVHRERFYAQLKSVNTQINTSNK